MIGDKGKTEDTGHVENDTGVCIGEPISDTGTVELHHRPEIDGHGCTPTVIGTFIQGGVAELAPTNAGNVEQYIHAGKPSNGGLEYPFRSFGLNEVFGKKTSPVAKSTVLATVSLLATQAEWHLW